MLSSNSALGNPRSRKMQSNRISVDFPNLKLIEANAISQNLNIIRPFGRHVLHKCGVLAGYSDWVRFGDRRTSERSTAILRLVPAFGVEILVDWICSWAFWKAIHVQDMLMFFKSLISYAKSKLTLRQELRRASGLGGEFSNSSIGRTSNGRATAPQTVG